MATSQTLREKYRSLQRLHILVVEDDRFAREQLGLLLARFAGRLSTAENGAEGLETFKYERPDMVITDISMPHMDGLEMAAAIKAMDPATPVILVTAHSDTEFFLRSIEIGIDGFLVKPVSAEALLALVAKQAASLLSSRAAEARARLFQFTLDINPNFILTLDNDEVDYVNRTFLDFLGAPSLEGLRRGEHADRQLEIDGRCYAASDFTWTKRVGNRPDATHQALFPCLPGTAGRDRTFLVSSADFPELDRRVLTFTDITPLAEERRQLIIRAATDALTGIANRAGLNDVLERELNRRARHETPLSVIMLDIDHFKNINDTYGHPAGDAVLVALTQLVAGHVRDHDTLGRFGGEEFLIIAPDTDATDATALAERLRTAVENHLFPAAGGVTCSFGLATMGPGDNAETLVARADAALYVAKGDGRNRVALG